MLLLCSLPLSCCCDDYGVGVMVEATVVTTTTGSLCDPPGMEEKGSRGFSHHPILG